MDAQMQIPQVQRSVSVGSQTDQELWISEEIVVQREGQDIELFFDAVDLESRETGSQTERVREREVDRRLAESQRRIRICLDELKARNQHGGPQKVEAAVQTEEALEERAEELKDGLRAQEELLREKKEELEEAQAENGRLAANLAQATLELRDAAGIEEGLRQELLVLRARLTEADEAQRRLAAQLEVALQAIDIPVEPEMAAELQPQEDRFELLLRPDVDQDATPRRRRRSSSPSGSDRPDVKRSRSEDASPASSVDVFRTPERDVEQARNGHNVTSGQEEKEEEEEVQEPRLEEEDEVVPESDQEELAETSSSSGQTPPPSPQATPTRTPSPSQATPTRTPSPSQATPTRTPSPPVQPVRRQRRARVVMGPVKRSGRIGNQLPGPLPKPPVAAQPIALAVLAPQTAAQVGDTIRKRLKDYDSGVYIQNLAVVVKLGRYLTTARRLSRSLPSSPKDLQDLESLKDNLSRLF